MNIPVASQGRRTELAKGRMRNMGIKSSGVGSEEGRNNVERGSTEIVFSAVCHSLLSLQGFDLTLRSPPFDILSPRPSVVLFATLSEQREQLALVPSRDIGEESCNTTFTPRCLEKPLESTVIVRVVNMSAQVESFLTSSSTPAKGCSSRNKRKRGDSVTQKRHKAGLVFILSRENNVAPRRKPGMRPNPSTLRTPFANERSSAVSRGALRCLRSSDGLYSRSLGY